MNNQAIKTVEKYNMLSNGDRVLVAVSGGADSMALLSFLLSIKDKYSLDICVAHIEHGIRSDESKADAEFVKNFCNKNNLKFHLKTIDAPKLAKKLGKGVEEVSREERYKFFNTIECDKIATAHNLTDNIETLIFRLTRGTGLKGACSIPPVRGKIIRPLIEISSADIRTYCKQNNIEYRIDSTNFDDTYSRNLIRLNILPLLEKLNSDYQNNIANFISSINEDNSFIENQVLSVYDGVVADSGIDILKIIKFDEAVRKRIIKLYFENNGVKIDCFHLNEIEKLLYSSGKVQLFGDNFAVSAKGKLRFANLKKCTDCGEFVTEILNINEFNAKNIDFYCDCDKIVGSVTVRKRKAGDTVKPSGRGVTKTLKKLFNETAFPIEKRDDAIIVCDDDGIIGVIGICADERVKVDKGTKRVYSIKLPSED